jgi:AAA family ATP:ADP antiporter
VRFLLRFFGLDVATPAERSATLWIAAMSCAGMCSTFLLRPLRDQFGVDQGTQALPWLYSLTLIATVVAVLPFWWLANRMPSRRFVPIVLHVCAGLVALLALGLAAIGEYDWRQLKGLGEVFWGGFSALNVAVPALVWIHAVEHFRVEQARRLFSLIAVGATLGTVTGSWLAGTTSKGGAPLWAMALGSSLLLELALLAFLGSLRACRELGNGATRVASGGLGEGLRILARDRHALGIGVYMMLLGVLATAFYAAQTELVGKGVAQGREQHVWLATVEFWSQSLVLVLQLFCTGRLLQRWPGSALLVSLPIVSIVGLGALWLAPAVLTINLIQIGRRGAQYAFEKPAREVLYTPLALATKHKVKFLLDTFAFRFGDLLGALLAVQLRRSSLGPGGTVLITIAVALVWIALGLVLGRRRAEPRVD